MNEKDRTVFSQQIETKVKRKLKARNSSQGVWFGLGMMGLVGWSVAVPTLLLTWLGVWLDNRHTGTHSWTLMLLVIGLTIGCLNAWHWVTKEDKEMGEDQEGGVINTLNLVLALMVGILLGAIFFGGLWLTIQRGLSSQRSPLWFFGSLLLRTSIVLTGFYFIGRSDWERLLSCLLGFIIARLIANRLIQVEKKPTYLAREIQHAP